MYLTITEPIARLIVEAFKNTEFRDSDEENCFFQRYGFGNTVEVIDRPFERLNDYELLLSDLRREDKPKYEKAHKGTPFGFMSWFAFDLRNYEKALFYLDAGISEDFKNYHAGDAWLTLPGARFLLLDPDPGNLWLRRTFEDLRGLLDHELARFNGVSGEHLDLGSWQTMVKMLLEEGDGKWSLISALYLFLLESKDRRLELDLREGSTGGSNQPFMVHLFTGGVLFESLLKHYYKKADGTEFRTLEGILARCNEFSLDFFGGKEPFKGKNVFDADSLRTIRSYIGGDNSMKTAFMTTAKLRNAIGHNLVRDDIFSSSDGYVALFDQVMNAIFYVMLKVT